MSLLIEGINKKSVVKTDYKKRMTVDGLTKDYDVYEIKLDELYYNDQNDRISTWISQYKLDNNLDKIDMSNKLEYNEIIHKFITESNPEALKKTQNNIEMIEQQEYGVVLNDGRIIDGNRRFTCLRNLEKKHSKPKYFLAIILEHDIEDNAKAVKILELQLQHGVDKVIDYSPIDRLVGIYNDIEDKELLTIEEYAKSVDKTENDIKKELEKAKLMIEFLEFLNAPKQFHILREMELYFPIEELEKIVKKCRSEERRENFKTIGFSNIIMLPFGDIVRYIRKIGKIVNNSKFTDDYLEEQLVMAEKVLDIIEEQPVMTSKVINEKIRSEDIVKEELRRSTEKWVERTDSDTNKNQPAKFTDKAIEMIESIDTNIFNKLTDEQKKDVLNKVEELEDLLQNIKKELNN